MLSRRLANGSMMCEPTLSMDHSNLFDTDWRFEWHNKRILVVGDNRVESIESWTSPSIIPNLQCRWKRGAKFIEVLDLAEQELESYPETEILLLVGLHCDYTCMQNTSWNVRLMFTTKPNIDNIVNEYAKRIFQWTEKYPDLFIIPTTPFIPDFYKYNMIRLSSSNSYQKALLNKDEMQEHQRRYRDTNNEFFDKWREVMELKPYSLGSIYRRTKRRLRHLRDSILPFHGSTIDGLHFSHQTVEKFWMDVLRHGQHTKNLMDKTKVQPLWTHQRFIERKHKIMKKFQRLEEEEKRLLEEEEMYAAEWDKMKLLEKLNSSEDEEEEIIVDEEIGIEIINNEATEEIPTSSHITSQSYKKRDLSPISFLENKIKDQKRTRNMNFSDPLKDVRQSEQQMEFTSSTLGQSSEQVVHTRMAWEQRRPLILNEFRKKKKIRW